MRALALIIVILTAGCVHGDWTAEAARLQIPEAEFISITQQLPQGFELVVFKIEKTASDVIEVWLTAAPKAPHGIIIVFRKIDGQWREDPKSQGSWIV